MWRLQVKDMDFGAGMTWSPISARFLINYAFPGKQLHLVNPWLSVYKM